MSGTIGYEELRAGTIRQVAQLMAAAAITAPKSGGQLLLAGKPNFTETVIAEDPGTRRDHAVALSLSMTHKATGFDRPMPEADFDNLDLAPTGTQPVGVPGAARQEGARNREAPRQPTRRTQP